LKGLGILVDRDNEVLFAADIIQASGRPANAFFRNHSAQWARRVLAKANFKALFEAIEREQAARGNL